MTNNLELAANHIEDVNNVVTEYLKGYNASEIAKMTGYTRQRVLGYLNEWRGMIANNEAIRTRAKEALAGADAHYNKLIQKAYEVIDSADARDNLGAKSGAIKLIADMEAKRIDLLQKAGMLDNKELAEEMADTERKQELLEGILKDVVAHCDTCRNEVMRRLAEVSDEPVVVEHVG